MKNLSLIGLWLSLWSAVGFAAMKGKVTDYSKRDHLVSVEFPDDHGIKEGDFILIPFEGGYRCRLEVIKVLGENVVAHTRHCVNESQLKPGVEVESDPYGDDRTQYPPPKDEPPETLGPVNYDNILAERVDEPPQEVGQKSKNEWWYLYWGAGWGQVSYPDKDRVVIDGLKASSGVSHLTFLLDMLGVYFPRKNFKTMFGGDISLAVDRFSNPTGAAQTSQYLISTSGVHFFGTNIGDGVFVRGDFGIAVQSRQADGSGLGVGGSGYYLGFGMLAGLGYGIPISSGTRLLATALYAIRVMPNGNWGTFGLTVGLLL